MIRFSQGGSRGADGFPSKPIYINADQIIAVKPDLDGNTKIVTTGHSTRRGGSTTLAISSPPTKDAATKPVWKAQSTPTTASLCKNDVRLRNPRLPPSRTQSKCKFWVSSSAICLLRIFSLKSRSRSKVAPRFPFRSLWTPKNAKKKT